MLCVLEHGQERLFINNADLPPLLRGRKIQDPHKKKHSRTLDGWGCDKGRGDPTRTPQPFSCPWAELLGSEWLHLPEPAPTAALGIVRAMKAAEKVLGSKQHLSTGRTGLCFENYHRGRCHLPLGFLINSAHFLCMAEAAAWLVRCVTPMFPPHLCCLCSHSAPTLGSTPCTNSLGSTPYTYTGINTLHLHWDQCPAATPMQKVGHS